MRDHPKPPVAAILVIPFAVALLLTLFAWPNARLHPRDLPIGVAGPGAAAVESTLTAADGAFEVHRYADAHAAREAIENREVYGAFVLSAAGPTVLTASAASPAVAQLLGHAAAELPGSAGSTPVVDVVAAPRGAALASSVLPMVLAGIMTGALAAAIAAALALTVLAISSVVAGLHRLRGAKGIGLAAASWC